MSANKCTIVHPAISVYVFVAIVLLSVQLSDAWVAWANGLCRDALISFSTDLDRIPPHPYQVVKKKVLF